MPPKRKAPNDSNNNAYENTDRNRALRVVRDRALRAGDPELALLVAHLSRGTRNRAVSRTAAMLVREKRAFQRSLLTAVPANASSRAARFAEVEVSIRKAWKDPALFRSLDGAALDRALVTYAPWAGTEGVVKLLLAHPKVDVNARTQRGFTALMLAASNGHEAVVRMLLAHPKIDVNARRRFGSGSAALIYAASSGHEGVVRLLLGHPKIDVNARNPWGWTALILAASKGHEGIVRALLGHPTLGVNAKNGFGITALISAASKGREGIIRMLLAHPKIDVNARDENGRTALSSARTDRLRAMLVRAGARA